MKFRKRYKVLNEISFNDVALRRELNEYEFDGAIDFTYGPTFVFDVTHFFVLPPEPDSLDSGNKILIEEDNKIVDVISDSVKFMQTASLKLKRDFALQDFFDKNKEASCIIFYVNPDHPDTIFHPGNIIRAAVIN